MTDTTALKERRVMPGEPLTAAVRAAITNAYYEARDHGETMEKAADIATADVMLVLDGLREAAQRLSDTYADKVAVKGLGLGWKREMDADDAFLCALQDTRTALDGKERPHVHKADGSAE